MLGVLRLLNQLCQSACFHSDSLYAHATGTFHLARFPYNLQTSAGTDVLSLCACQANILNKKDLNKQTF